MGLGFPKRGPQLRKSFGGVPPPLWGGAHSFFGCGGGNGVKSVFPRGGYQHHFSVTGGGGAYNKGPRLVRRELTAHGDNNSGGGR